MKMKIQVVKAFDGEWGIMIGHEGQLHSDSIFIPNAPAHNRTVFFYTHQQAAIFVMDFLEYEDLQIRN